MPSFRMPTQTYAQRVCSSLLFGAFVALLVLGATPTPSAAQEGGTGATAADPVPPEQLSPRAVLKAFLERMARDEKREAAKLLDLSGLSAEAVTAKSPELAYKLYSVMQRVLTMPPGVSWPPVEDEFALYEASEKPDFAGVWSLDVLTRFDPREEAKQIEIVRNGQGRWQFSAQSVAAIEKLYREFEEVAAPVEVSPDAATTVPFSVWYSELFPSAFRDQYFLMPTYQWISLLLIALAGRVAETTSRRGLTAVADFLLHRYDDDFEESSTSVWKPVGRLVQAAMWYGGAYAIGLPTEVVSVLLIVLRIVTLLAAVWAAFAVIDLLADYFSRRAKRSDRKFDDLVVPVAATTARVIAVLASVILAAAAFSEEIPSTLLGGLGIGGVAIALASQETLSNFFGSITVLFDRPFEVGDWVRVEGIEGEVESVGFRSTRIRTGMNSQVTLPNNKIASAAIDNWGRRRYRRYLTRLGVEYNTTPEQMEAFCEGIRELIRRQPHTRKDFYAAYFNEYGASALEVLLVVFFEVPDWPTELRERHRLLADILRLAERLEIGFAFPTQTLHLHQSDSTSGAMPEIDDPTHTGQVEAAAVAGELLNYQDRPGKVKFPGPANV